MSPQPEIYQEILDSVLSGRYVVDLDSGEVFPQNRLDKPLHVFTGKNPRNGEPEPYKFVRLYPGGKQVGISLAKLVWMAGSKSLVPEGFEIHHRDLDPSNNSWMNLMCLHNLDHDKLHGGGYVTECEDKEVPF